MVSFARLVLHGLEQASTIFIHFLAISSIHSFFVGPLSLPVCFHPVPPGCGKLPGHMELVTSGCRFVTSCGFFWTVETQLRPSAAVLASHPELNGEVTCQEAHAAHANAVLQRLSFKSSMQTE